MAKLSVIQFPGTQAASAKEITGEISLANDGTVSFRNLTRAFKATDTSRSSNATPSADPDLSFTLSDETWRFGFVCFVTSASATPGLKFALSGSLATGHIRYHATVKSSIEFPGETTFAANHSAELIAAARHAVLIDGYIEVSSPGTFALYWSQDVSNGTATILERGSYGFVERIG